MDFSFTDDFLLEEDDIDVIPLENDLELIDEEEDYSYTQPKYFNKELLNIGGFDVKLKDIFVMKPRKEKIKKKVQVTC